MDNIKKFKALSKAEKRPSFESVMFRAEMLATDSDADAVQSVLLMAGRLPSIEKVKVLKQMKKSTGLSEGDLKKAMYEDRDPSMTKPDQFALARIVLEQYGRENLIGTTAHVLYWSGSVWKVIEDRSLKKMIQDTFFEKGIEITKALVDSVSEVLKTEIFVPDHEWNPDPNIINFTNGELRHKNGEWFLEEHCRDHYLTTQIPHAYDPKAKADRFMRFLGEIFAPDEDKKDKARVVLEMVGYSMASHAKYEKFILLLGPGANGKSVLMDVVREIVGAEYVAAVQPSQFSRAFQRAHLHMKLVNLVTEIPEGAVMADAETKAIVSGEMTTVEHKNKHPFNLRPFATCWFGANHLPHTRDFSDALFRRAIVVPFNRVFHAGVDADPDLKEMLKQEITGIIALALKVYSRVINSNGKFTESLSCSTAKDDWRYEADQAAQCIAEKCIKDPEAKISSSVLYNDAYKPWALENGISSRLGKNSFSKRVSRLGYALTRGTNGVRMISGLRLKDGDSETEAAMFG